MSKELIVGRINQISTDRPVTGVEGRAPLPLSKDSLADRDAEIAKLKAIIARSVEWWLREGKEQFDGAPEWVFAARELKL